MAVEKFPDEISAIRAMLSEHPEGLTIRSISALLGMNRNSVAKYLEMLQMQGGLTLKRSGPSKIYCLADKLPAAAVLKLTKSHVIIFDQLLTAADVNDSFTDLLKISKKEILGKILDDLPFVVQCHPDLRTLIKEGIRGKESKTSASIKTDNRLIHCMLTCSPVFFENGNNGVSLIIDLEQEPKNGDVPVNNGDDLLTGLDESEYICRFAPDGTLTYVNSAYCDLLQKTRTGLIGHKWRPAIPESEYQKITKALHSINSAHTVALEEIKVITPLGNSQWQRWKFRILLDENKKSTGFQATGLDITELKKLELKISKYTEETDKLLKEHKDEVLDLNKQIFKEIASREKAHFQLLFTEFAMDNASYMITWITRDGRFVYMNREAQKVLGYHYHDMVSKKFIDIVAGVFSFPWDDVWEKIKTDQRYTLEIVLVTSKGDEIPVEMVLNYLEFKDKQYCCCFARDITEKKKSEDSLKESEQKYRDIFEKSVLGLFKSTPGGQLIDANDAFARMYGYSNAAEILAAGLNIGNDIYADPKDRKEVLRILEEHGKIENYETLHIKRDGTSFWVLITARTIRNKDGNVVLYEGTYVDNTERKLAEEALKKSETRYKNISEATTDFVFSCSNTDNGSLSIEWMTGAVEKITGYTIDELFAMKCWRCLVLPEDIPVFDENVTDIPAGSSRTCQLRIRTKIGTVRWLAVNTTHVPAQEPMTLDHIFGGCKDITERILVEEALVESEAQLRLSVQSANIGLWEWDVKRDTVYFSPEWKSQIGYRDDELPNLFDEWQKRLHPDDLERTLQKLRTYLANPEEQYDYEFRLKHKDGSYRWINSHADVLRDADGKPERMLGGHIDITGHKLAEEAMQMHSEIVQNMAEGVVLISASDGKIVYANPRFEKMFGYDPDELCGKPVSMINAPDVRSSQTIADEIMSTLHHTGVWNGELLNIRKDGTTLWCHATVSTFDHPQFGQVWVSVHMDISRRKQAEEALRHREHDFSTLVENATDMIVRFDSHMRYIYCNPAVERQLGIPFHQLVGKTPLEFGTSVEQSQFIDESLRRTLETGIEQEVEQPYPTPSGLRYFLTRVVPERDDNGSIVSLLAISRDITDRKQAEEALQKKSQKDLKKSSDNLQRTETDLQIHQTELEVQNEELRQAQRDLEVSRERYFELYDLAPAGYLTISDKGLIVNANLTAASMLGVERGNLVNKPVSRYILKEDQEIFYYWRHKLIETREKQSCELRMLHSSGSMFLVQMIGVPSPSVEGKEAAISMMMIDITERKQPGESAQKSIEIFTSIFENHDSVMLLIEPDNGKIIDANRAAERFYGRSRENLCTMSIDEINTLPADEIKALRAEVARGQITSFTTKHRCSSGDIRSVDVHSSPITIAGKTVLFSIIHDITDRKKDRKDTKKNPAKEHYLR